MRRRSRALGWLFVLFVLAALVPASSAVGAVSVVLVDGRATLEAELGPPVATIDFESIPGFVHGQGASSSGCPDPSPLLVDNPMTDGDVTISHPTCLRFVTTPIYMGHATDDERHIGIPLQGLSAPVSVSFASGYCGVGFDMWHGGNSGMALGTITVTDGSGATGTWSVLNDGYPPPGPLGVAFRDNFIGFSSPSGITSASVSPETIFWAGVSGGHLDAIYLFGCPLDDDADDDGIPDALDVPGAAVAFSDSTPPALGAGTHGVITQTNGLVVTVEDVNPTASSSPLRIAASGAGTGPVEVRPCGLALSLFLNAGDTVTIDCGSVTIVVEEGDGVTVSAGQATITLPAEATATLDTNAAGATVVSGVLNGSVTVSVGGVTSVVGPGQSGTFSTLNRFVGFTQPVDMVGFNMAKAGSVIPLKWRVINSQGAPVTTITGATVSVKPSSACSGGAAGDEIETYVSGNQTALQNLGSGYYELDWKTNKNWAGTCKQLVFSLNGATVVDAGPAFGFK